MYIDHASQRAPPPYRHEGPVRDIGKMHGHGSARVERVCSSVFWGKAKPGCSDPNGLGLKDGDDVRGADQAEPLSGGIVAGGGGSWAPMFVHTEEDADPARIGQAAADSNQEWETDSPRIALFWLSRARTI